MAAVNGRENPNNGDDQHEDKGLNAYKIGVCGCNHCLKYDMRSIYCICGHFVCDKCIQYYLRTTEYKIKCPICQSVTVTRLPKPFLRPMKCAFKKDQRNGFGAAASTEDNNGHQYLNCFFICCFIFLLFFGMLYLAISLEKHI